MLKWPEKLHWKWIAIPAAASCVLAAAAAAFFVNEAVKKAQPSLIAAVEKALPDHAVRMGSLAYKFPLSAEARNIALSNPGGFDNGTALQAESIQIRIRIPALLKALPFFLKNGTAGLRFNAAPGTGPSLGSSAAILRIVQPRLSLERKEGRWNFIAPSRDPGAPKGNSAIPPVAFEIEEGSLEVRDDQQTLDGLTFKGLQAFVDFNPTDPKASFALRGAAGETIQLKGKQSLPGIFHIEAEIREMSVLDWTRRFGKIPETFPVRNDRLDADISLDLQSPAGSAGATDFRSIEGWDWSGKFKVLEHRAELETGREKKALRGTGEIEFSRQSLRVKSAEYKAPASSVKLEGEIVRLGAEAQMDFKSEAFVDGSDLAGYLPLHLKPEGRLTISAAVRGPINDAKIEGQVRSAGTKLASRPFELNASIAVASKTLDIRSLTAAWGESSATAKGVWSQREWDAVASLRSLPLEYFYPDGKSDLEGRVSLQLRARGSGDNPAITGQVAARNFVFLRNKVGSISGDVRVRNNAAYLRLATPDSQNRVVLDVARSPKQVILRQLAVFLTNGQHLKIAGSLDRQTRTIGGELTATAVAFSTFGDSLKFLSPFDGKIYANGQFSGTWEDPLLEGTLRANNIFFKDRDVQAEALENFSSKFAWNKTALTLPAFNIGPSYSGRVTVLKHPHREFSVEATARDANPRILFALISLPPDVTGQLNGTAKFTRRTETGGGPAFTMSGNGNLRIAKGRWAKMPFDLFTVRYLFDEKEGLKVTEFRMKQPQGLLDLTASARQDAASNPLIVQGNLQNFSVSKIRLDGPVALNGQLILEEKPHVSGRLTSDSFKINRIRIGKTEAGLEWKDRALSLSGISLGRLIEGDLSVTVSEAKKESPALKGSWHSKPQPVEDWIELLQISTPPIRGKMSLSGSLAGTIKNPQVNLDYEFFDIKIVLPRNREIESSLAGLNGAGAAILGDDLLKSLNATLTRGDNERITVLGQANFQTQTLNLQASIHQIDSKILFQPLGLKKFEGPMDGTLSIDGNWSAPVIRGDLRGKGGMLGDMAMESWEVAGTFKQKEFTFTRMIARGQRRAWRFSILEDSWIRPHGESKGGIFRLNTDFANVSIGPVFLVGNGILEGNWDQDPAAEQPVFTGFARINELTANNFEIKPTKLIVQYHDKKLKFLPRQPNDPAFPARPDEPVVIGEFDFTKLPCLLVKQFSVSSAGKRIFFLDGELCKDEPLFYIEGNGVDASLLSGVFSSPIPLAGQSDFRIEGKKTGTATYIAGFIHMANGKVFEIPMETLDSKFLWKDGVFNLESLEAKSKEYFNLSGSGRIPLAWGKMKAADTGMDFSLKCTNGNLAFVNRFDSEIIRNAGGAFTAQVALKGTARSPVVNGSFKLNDGEMNSKYLGRSLQNVQVSLQIKNNKLSVQKAEGEASNQKVQVSGDAALVFDAGDMTLDHFNLRLKTIGNEGLPIQVPELPAVRVNSRLGLPAAPSKGSVIASLTLAGRAERPKIGGEVILNDVLFSYPPPKKETERRSLLDAVDWDVTLKAGKRTIFQNDVAYAKLDGSIRFTSSEDGLIAKGKLTSHEGNITFLGARFDIVNASLEAQPPARYTLGQSSVTLAEQKSVAYLSLRAEQRKQVVINGQEVEDTITMQIDRTPLSDKFDSKSITFRSSARPNLDSERVVSSAAGFETDFQNLTPEQKDIQLRQGMARILDTQLASPLAKSILQTIGIADRIEITQDEDYGRDGRKARSAEVRGDTPSSLDALVGQTFLVEKTFASRLGVGYRATFDKIQDRADFIHQLQLRYPFYKGFYFIGSTELDSEENLGRQRERYGGIETRVRWDFPDLINWMRKKDPEPGSDPASVPQKPK